MGHSNIFLGDGKRVSKRCLTKGPPDLLWSLMCMMETMTELYPKKDIYEDLVGGGKRKQEEES